MSLKKQSPPKKVAGSADAIAGQAGPLNQKPLETLLQRLECVRNAGQGYRARCPSCGGKSDKVSITEADNGAVLIHAFCGCSPAAVLGAVGLQLADLFPARLRPISDAERRESRRRMREISWAAALNVIVCESTIVQIAGQQIARWLVLSEEDDVRLNLACERITGAQAVLNGR